MVTKRHRHVSFGLQGISIDVFLFLSFSPFFFFLLWIILNIQKPPPRLERLIRMKSRIAFEVSYPSTTNIWGRLIPGGGGLSCAVKGVCQPS